MLTKEAFFGEMEASGLSPGFDEIIAESGPSEQTLKAILEGNFDSNEATEPDLSSPCTRNSTNKLPILSSAMDTVTEAETAIVMADCGGRGVIHAGLDPQRQFEELEKVKKRLNGLIDEPKTIKVDDTFEEVNKQVDKLGVTTFPVIDNQRRLIGLVTGHQIKRSRPHEKVTDKMKPVNEVVVSNKRIAIHEAYDKMLKDDINMLPIVDDDGTLNGLYVISDAKRIVEGNIGNRNVDDKNRYVGAIAVPTDDSAFERIDLCLPYLVDRGGIVVVDTAQGDGYFAFKYLKALKEKYEDQVDFLVGNITNPKSAVLLAQIGADGIKVGQASGAVCTTFEETGIGRGQVMAVWECAKALREAGFGDVPVCSDGGIRKHGDVAKALGAGATSVMIGTRFAGTYEAPGDKIELPDGSLVKMVRGMGSLPALLASAAARERYGGKMPLPEGKVDYVPYVGPLAPVVMDFYRALRKSMLYTGFVNLKSYSDNVRFEYKPLRN